MSYAEALERLKKLPPLPGGELTKPTKGAFVSYGSTRVGHSEKNTPSESARLPTPEPAPKRAQVDNRLSAPVLALVRCGQCRHFEPNANNPGQGLGRCGAGAEGERLPWPNAPRHCATWNPTPAALLDICRAACDGLAVEPEELARWLLAQDDARWMTPPAVRRWARHINEHGYPKDES